MEALVRFTLGAILLGPGDEKLIVTGVLRELSGKLLTFRRISQGRTLRQRGLALCAHIIMSLVISGLKAAGLSWELYQTNIWS
jgi:hypothetical protein